MIRSYSRVRTLSGKNAADDYIKSDHVLLQKTTFPWVTFYACNILFPIFKPFEVPTAPLGKYIQLQRTPPSAPLKTIGDVRANVGVSPQHIIERPEPTLMVRFVAADAEDTTAGGFLASWAEAQDKKARYVQVPREVFYGTWPVWGEAMVKMMAYFEDAGNEASWSGEEGILTKEELGIEASQLVKSLDAMAPMRDGD